MFKALIAGTDISRRLNAKKYMLRLLQVTYKVQIKRGSRHSLMTKEIWSGLHASNCQVKDA